jgi:sensor histidine kinase YesM
MKGFILKKNNVAFIALLNVVALVVIFLVTGLLSGLVLSSIFKEFSFKLLRIVTINAIFFSSGIILNSFVARFFFNRIDSFLIIIISFFLILGFNIVGTVFLFLIDPLYFYFGNNIILPYLTINFFFVLSVSIITTGFVIYEESIKLREKQLNDEILLRQQMENKLFASKINPHFLFNSLNLIVSLLKDTKLAEKILFNLSDLLRYNITAAEKNSISVNEEIENVGRYLFIQKQRFGERLDYEITGGCDGMIPPLIIQPLVENSIKHNIDNINYLKIEIDIGKKDNFLEISISDTCRKLTDEMIGNGIGLLNTKKRVEIHGGKFIISNGGIKIKFAYDKNSNS